MNSSYADWQRLAKSTLTHLLAFSSFEEKGMPMTSAKMPTIPVSSIAHLLVDQLSARRRLRGERAAMQRL